MRLSAFLFFLASSLAGYGQSQILITNLAEQQKLGREFVQELLSQTPTENTKAFGVIKIRDAKGKAVEVPVKFQIVSTTTNWQTIYEIGWTNVIAPGEGYPEIQKLFITHSQNRTNGYKRETVTGYSGASEIPAGLAVTFTNSSHENIAQHTHYVKGQPVGGELMQPFAGSDFWLADLGLEFFHWPEQRMIKKEMSRSQFCKVIESINPTPATNAYSKVVSWIQHEGGGIVHAEAYNANGKLLKIFEPKEIEKVNGQWQLREMEMRNVQTKSRTRIEFDLETK